MTSIITYDQMKYFYEKFKQNLPKDKLERYYQEFTFMQNLINFAKKQGLEKDVFEYQKIQNAAIEQLKKLGHNVKI